MVGLLGYLAAVAVLSFPLLLALTSSSLRWLVNFFASDARAQPSAWIPGIVIRLQVLPSSVPSILVRALFSSFRASFSRSSLGRRKPHPSRAATSHVSFCSIPVLVSLQYTERTFVFTPHFTVYFPSATRLESLCPWATGTDSRVTHIIGQPEKAPTRETSPPTPSNFDTATPEIVFDRRPLCIASTNSGEGPLLDTPANSLWMYEASVSSR